MDIGLTREVDFTKCNECVHKNKTEDEFPCDECMSEPVAEYSRVPSMFESAT